MKKVIVKKLSKSFLEVTIDTSDGYFSVTGNLWEKLPKGYKCLDYKIFNGSKYEITIGGSIHEFILKHLPMLEPIIKLHLSDLEGKPMHYISNGVYWFNKDKDKGFDYWRVKPEDRMQVKNVDDFILLLPKITEQWKEEAKVATLIATEFS